MPAPPPPSAGPNARRRRWPPTATPCPRCPRPLGFPPASVITGNVPRRVQASGASFGIALGLEPVAQSTRDRLRSSLPWPFQAPRLASSHSNAPKQGACRVASASRQTTARQQNTKAPVGWPVAGLYGLARGSHPSCELPGLPRSRTPWRRSPRAPVIRPLDSHNPQRRCPSGPISHVFPFAFPCSVIAVGSSCGHRPACASVVAPFGVPDEKRRANRWQRPARIRGSRSPNTEGEPTGWPSDGPPAAQRICKLAATQQGASPALRSPSQTPGRLLWLPESAAGKRPRGGPDAFELAAGLSGLEGRSLSHQRKNHHLRSGPRP